MDTPKHEQFKTLPPIYSHGSEPSMSQPQAEYAAGRAKMLLGCYRKGDAADPDTYAAAIAAVLSEYPPEIIRRATDPRIGIASKSKWLPTVAHVKEFCESEFAPVRRQQERDRLAEDRARALPPPVDDRSTRPTYDELKAKAGPNWGLTAVEDDAERSRKAQIKKNIERANQIAFDRECAAAGIDPALGVSPSLLATLKPESQ